MLGAGVATAGAAVLMSDAQPERRDDREALRQAAVDLHEP